MPPRNHKSPLSPELIHQMKRDAAILKASQDILRVYDEFSAKIDQFNTIISSKYGPRGEKGDKPSDQEVSAHIAGMLPDLVPKVSEEYLKALIEPFIPDVRDGIDGKDGEHGSTPVKGLDYMTDDDMEVIAKKTLRLIKPPEIDHKLILGALNKAGKPVLKPEHIDGLEQLFSKTLDNRGVRGYVHGGGDTVKAGSNITLIRNSDGTTTIAATGSSGTVVNEEVVSFSGTTGTLAHTPTAGTLKLFRGGARQQAGAGNDYTLSGSTITLATALQTGEILLADYRY